MSAPSIKITTYIASTPEKLWNALTDANITERYWMGTRVESDWNVGSKVHQPRNGELVDEHVLLSFEPPWRMSHTFHPVFNDEFRREPPSRVTFDIGEGGRDVVRLRLS